MAGPSLQAPTRHRGWLVKTWYEGGFAMRATLMQAPVLPRRALAVCCIGKGQYGTRCRQIESTLPPRLSLGLRQLCGAARDSVARAEMALWSKL